MANQEKTNREEDGKVEKLPQGGYEQQLIPNRFERRPIMTKDTAELLVMLSTVALYVSLCYFIATYYINSPIAMKDLAESKTLFVLYVSFVPSLASIGASTAWCAIWTLIIDNKFPKEKKDKNTYKFK